MFGFETEERSGGSAIYDSGDEAAPNGVADPNPPPNPEPNPPGVARLLLACPLTWCLLMIALSLVSGSRRGYWLNCRLEGLS